MNPAELKYQSTGSGLKGAVLSQMFGKPCFKVNGKAFLCYFEESMVFKLPKESLDEALNLPGAKLFDPSGKNRPMKEWVQIPYKYDHCWAIYSEVAFNYVSAV
ncbi:MAG: hypothetical protein HXX13_08470 [Bacteroidetes bacterium]|nr:hypothetical protein [Bacteroidota bacterium]